MFIRDYVSNDDDYYIITSMLDIEVWEFRLQNRC
jgi:hypothetical protein